MRSIGHGALDCKYIVTLFGASCPSECQDSNGMSLGGSFVCLFKHLFPIISFQIWKQVINFVLSVWQASLDFIFSCRKQDILIVPE